ncbi:uncharacterized protein LOC142741775 [Rhinoderma darwinii]|uniref:uncharacterized protein LOC142741775 n=1 Tax=Rhinoderma darwinii TaxID=43563 RepID=UPI003F66C360
MSSMHNRYNITDDPVSADITTTTQGSTPPTENDLQGTDKTSAATVTSLPSTTTTYTEGVSNGISTKVKKIKKIIVPRGNFHGVSYGIATKEKQLKKIIVPRGNFHGVSYRIPTKEKQLKKIIVPRGNFHERKISAGLRYPKKRVETPYPEVETDFDRDLKALKKMLARPRKIQGRKINAGLQHPEKTEDTTYRQELEQAPPDDDEEESYPWMLDTTTEVSTTISTTIPTMYKTRAITVDTTTSQRATTMSTTATTIDTTPVQTAAPESDLLATTTPAVSVDYTLRNIIIISCAVGVPLLLVAVLLFIVLLKLQRLQKLLEIQRV